MRLPISGISKEKLSWQAGTKLFAAAVLAAAVLFTVHTAGASTVTLVVDDDGQATSGNCNSTTATPYTTIGAAITAASATDTVKVCPGAYAENVVVDKTLTLKGAKAGSDVSSRTFGAANES